MIRNIFSFVNIEKLPPDDLEKLSDNLHRLARHINFIATRKRKKEAPENSPYKAHQRRVFAACKVVYDKKDTSDLENEIRKAAWKYDVDESSIITILPIYKRRRLQIRKIENERKILRYYRLGYTDKKISETVGLHEKTVSKIRRQLLAEIKKPPEYGNFFSIFAA